MSRGEAPVDGGASLVALGLPWCYAGFNGVKVGEATAEGLAGEHRPFDFCLIQPGAVLRGVVKLEPPGQAPGLVSGEGLVERRRGMGAEGFRQVILIEVGC